jgi:hypothetical protein
MSRVLLYTAFLIGAWAVLRAADPPAALTIRAYPERVALSGPHASQRLVVIGTRADGSIADLTRAARIASLDPGVASAGALPGETRPAILPAGDGETRVRIEVDGAAVEVPVAVRGFAADAPPRFTHDIVAGLTRAGCNSGACHGAQHG